MTGSQSAGPASLSWRWPITIAAGSALIYLLHFGPFLALLVWWDPPMNDTIGNGLQIVEYPHFWLMYRSESYFDYTAWWLNQDPGSFSPNWVEYRTHFEAR